MKDILKLLSFFFVFLLVAGVYFYFTHTEVGWVGSLVFSILFSIFFLCGCGSIIRAFLERADRRIIVAARRGGLLKDGKRSAVFGSIEPVDEPLRAPLSGELCVAYDYRIYHPREPEDPGSHIVFQKEARLGNGLSTDAVEDFQGWALTSSMIHAASGMIGLLGFPDLGTWRWKEHSNYEKANEYIRSTTFEKSSPKNIFSIADYVDAFIKNTTGIVREDIRHSDAQDATGLLLDERSVPVGAHVCAIGRYSAEHNGLVQDHGRGLRLVQGDSEEVSESLKTWSWVRIVLGLFMILISSGFLLPFMGGETDEARDTVHYEYPTSGYKVAYDLLEEGYSGWSFNIICFLLALFGVGLVWFVKKITNKIADKKERLRWLITPYVMVIFPIILGTVVLVSGLSEYYSMRKMLREGRASYVEGIVTDFYSGENYESFEVNGKRFSYDYKTVSAGFRQTKYHGGPIDEGVNVRIWHNRGTIVRLEVAKPAVSSSVR